MQVVGFLSVKLRLVLPVVHLPSYSHNCLTSESALLPFLQTVVKKLLTADRLSVTARYLATSTVADIFRCGCFPHGPSFDLRAFEGDLIRHCSRWSRLEWNSLRWSCKWQIADCRLLHPQNCFLQGLRQMYSSWWACLHETFDKDGYINLKLYGFEN